MDAQLICTGREGGQASEAHLTVKPWQASTLSLPGRAVFKKPEPCLTLASVIEPNLLLELPELVS